MQSTLSWLKYYEFYTKRNEGASFPPLSSTETESKTDDGGYCLLRAVTEAMRHEPALEAVKINRAAHSVSLATLGTVQRPEVELRLTRALADIQNEPSERRCGLWQGRE